MAVEVQWTDSSNDRHETANYFEVRNDGLLTVVSHKGPNGKLIAAYGPGQWAKAVVIETES